MEHNIFKVITASGSGTAFRVSPDGVMITNYHVVEGMKEVGVENSSKDRYVAKVLCVNPEADIAVLRAPSNCAMGAPISVGHDHKVQNLDKVLIHGYPFGLPYTITEGVVSSNKQMMGQRYYLQTDAAVNPGNSGGPMLDQEGRLLGVVTCKFNNADNVGFGITLEDVKEELSDIDYSCDKYKVRCHSCREFIIEKTAFCQNCGNNIEKTAFEDLELSDLATFVEDALVELKMNPVLARCGRDQWEFYQGSALIRLFIYRGEYLIATSPLNKLPKTKLNELYEFLLSNNAAPYMFGVSDNHIYISYRIHISAIFSSYASKVKKNIAELALKADDYDNFFMDNFGCEMAQEGKQEENNSEASSA